MKEMHLKENSLRRKAGFKMRLFLPFMELLWRVGGALTRPPPGRRGEGSASQ